MMDVSLANNLSACNPPDRFRLAVKPLPISVCDASSQAHNDINLCRGHHSVINGLEQAPVSVEGRQAPQQVEVTLVFS